MNRSRRTALCAGAFALFSASLAGCGDTLPAPSDPGEARKILTEALDAWKGGAKHDVKPSLRVMDRDWSEGSTLADYALEGDGQPLGQNIQQTVVLDLKPPKGKSVKKTVNYTVTTGANPMIARQDIDD